MVVVVVVERVMAGTEVLVAVEVGRKLMLLRSVEVADLAEAAEEHIVVVLLPFMVVPVVSEQAEAELLVLALLMEGRAAMVEAAALVMVKLV